MCNNQPGPRENSEQSWGGMYPDISEFLASNSGNQQGRDSQDDVIRNLLQALGMIPDQQDHASPPPSPSAPASSPSAPPREESRQEDVQQQHQQQHNNNSNNRCTGECQGQRQDVPDVIPILEEKMRHFTTIFGDTFRVVSTIFLILFLLSMMPNFIISNVVFMFIAGALGLHLPSVVAGNIILMILGNLHPLILIMLAMWAYHRTAVLKKPLFKCFQRQRAGGPRDFCFNFRRC